MLSNDVTIMRQMVAGLANPILSGNTAATNEFQRADAAPRLTLGDGRLDATDVVQARRYAANLDALTPAGGPTAPVAAPAAVESKALVEEMAANAADVRPRAMRVTSARAAAGDKVSVDVELDAIGDEIATSFTLYFDAIKLRNPQLALGSGTASDAVLTANTKNAADGRLTVLVDAGDAMMANGTKLVTITFDVAPGSTSGATQISFGSDPTPSAISDALGNQLDATYEAGTIDIAGSGSGAEISGRVTTADGSGLRGARVILTDTEGNSAVVVTSANGYYTLSGIAASRTYKLNVSSKRFRFETKTINLADSIADLNFKAQE